MGGRESVEQDAPLSRLAASPLDFAPRIELVLQPKPTNPRGKNQGSPCLLLRAVNGVHGNQAVLRRDRHLRSDLSTTVNRRDLCFSFLFILKIKVSNK